MVINRLLPVIISLTSLLPINKLHAQDFKGDELKSMEKYDGIKGENGIVAPELRL